ncbi:MAG: Threonine-tRNA ligase [Candidatus Magasanikbacteria bacterium GW2011_GWA2_46_17]|uniref:Threonine--tRNA ligase n=1 Tax=Candidatus Magasanikbacteria bacterium GW2011_GWA2_46_17 TaxID=1619042 RepID=A0A0G1P350_9BACT|nr:MAG: Threonine-tRNA ligase [Candidatus Magasanikbacteria bacterium GW2011_GWA2_46_17]
MSNKQTQNQNQVDLSIMRHSCAHLVAAAVQHLYPGAKFGVGPVVENGFFYDIDFPETIGEEDLAKIESKAKELMAMDLPFKRIEMDIDEAIEFFKGKNQDYKVSLLNDLKERGSTKMSQEELQELGGSVEKVSLYQTDEFMDLCRGPHVESTKQIGAFKLTKLAGAYWRGDNNNPQLQRIYGVCFAIQAELEEYLKMMEEAEKRDHRKIGKELDLFNIDETVGLGLPLWHPKGAILWRVIEDFWYREHLTSGYSLVRTPHIGNKVLWETSGHWGFYNESMYPPIEVGQTLKESQDKQDARESEQYLLKPMNCPFHIQIFKNRPHSYRELPLRWAECGTVYRYEKKGQLSGLVRVRGFTQDDAHIICRPDQVEEELRRVIDFILFMYRSFGFNIDDINVYLSVRDPSLDKYAGTEDGWQFTERVLEKVARENGLKIKKDIGGAVFYGPKLDFKILDCLKREWQCSTLQFDFNLPQRFDMNFINNQGQEERPYMLHRALFGSFERFIGLLIEHYAGAFPVWLSPVQVVLAPVSSKHVDGAQALARELAAAGIRMEIDEADETVGNKVRKAVKLKVPYIIVVGDKELSGEEWMIRVRGQEKQEKMKKEDFVAKVLGEIRERR